MNMSHVMNYAKQFSENKLMETYTKFINNFMQAKSNIQIAKEQLPMFAKFLGVRNFILSFSQFLMCDFILECITREQG